MKPAGVVVSGLRIWILPYWFGVPTSPPDTPPCQRICAGAFVLGPVSASSLPTIAKLRRSTTQSGPRLLRSKSSLYCANTGAVGVAVGVGIAVAVGVTVGVAVGVGIAVAVGVTVGVAVGVGGPAVGLAVGVGVAIGVAVGVIGKLD
jgi:hypothetical protein